MRELIQAALEVQTFMEQRSWRFCFIGGLAIQRWGQPRLTRDFDFSLLTGFAGEEVFVDALLERPSPIAQLIGWISKALPFARARP